MILPHANLVFFIAWWSQDYYASLMVSARASVARSLGGRCKALYELVQKSANIISIAFDWSSTLPKPLEEIRLHSSMGRVANNLYLYLIHDAS